MAESGPSAVAVMSTIRAARFASRSRRIALPLPSGPVWSRAGAGRPARRGPPSGPRGGLQIGIGPFQAFHGAGQVVARAGRRRSQRLAQPRGFGVEHRDPRLGLGQPVGLGGQIPSPSASALSSMRSSLSCPVRRRSAHPAWRSRPRRLRPGRSPACDRRRDDRPWPPGPGRRAAAPRSRPCGIGLRDQIGQPDLEVVDLVDLVGPGAGCGPEWRGHCRNRRGARPDRLHGRQLRGDPVAFAGDRRDLVARAGGLDLTLSGAAPEFRGGHLQPAGLARRSARIWSRFALISVRLAASRPRCAGGSGAYRRAQKLGMIIRAISPATRNRGRRKGRFHQVWSLRQRSRAMRH